MKRTDLKAGELYAVRRAGGPCLLLSTDLYLRSQHTWSTQSDSFQLAREGMKPTRSRSTFSGTDCGFIALTGDTEALASVDAAAVLAALLEHGASPGALPEGTRVEFVTSLAAFLAPYEQHRKAEAARLTAEQSRRDRERDRRLAAVARHNAVARRINKACGEDVIGLAPLDGYTEPTHVELTLAHAEALADLLEGVAS